MLLVRLGLMALMALKDQRALKVKMALRARLAAYLDWRLFKQTATSVAVLFRLRRWHARQERL